MEAKLVSSSGGGKSLEPQQDRTELAKISKRYITVLSTIQLIKLENSSHRTTIR